MHPKTILVVDDEKSTTDLISYSLRIKGYITHCAYGGAQGLQKAIELQPDLVLLDLNMPDINGLEWLAELKARRVFLRVIVITAKGDLQTAVSAIKAGAYDFMAKPVSLETLFWRVERAIVLQEAATVPAIRQDDPIYRDYYETVASLMKSHNYDAAVVEAFKFLEEQLRSILQVSADEYYGEKLINMAFAQNDGKLQMGRGDSEQKALRNFVSGAYALFRNPAAHRQVRFDEFSASTITNMVVLICDIANTIKSKSMEQSP